MKQQKPILRFFFSFFIISSNVDVYLYGYVILFYSPRCCCCCVHLTPLDRVRVHMKLNRLD